MVDRTKVQAGVTGTLLGLSFITVCARCYVRVFMSKAFGYDDVLAIILLILYACFSAFVFVAIHHGLGQHIFTLTADQYTGAMKAYYLSELFYAAASTMVKIAVGALYLRITTKRAHIWIIWFIVIFASVFGVVLFFQVLFQCAPISFFWSDARNPLDGHCTNITTELAFTYTHAAVSAIGDLTFGIIPVFFIKGLQMNKRSKITICILLCIANIATIATFARIPAIKQIGESFDFLFSSMDLAIWSSVEIGMATMMVSVSPLRPLFRTCLSNGSSRGIYDYKSDGPPIPPSRNGYIRSGSGGEYGVSLQGRKPAGTTKSEICSGNSEDRIVPNEEEADEIALSEAQNRRLNKESIRMWRDVTVAS